MAERTDIRVDWNVSPRVIQIDAPSVELNLQDLVDTIREIEDGPAGSLINPEIPQQNQAITEPHLLNAAGKEPLGGAVSVGITVSLQNAQISFEARNTAISSGTHDGSSGSADLVDSTADFLGDGVVRGDTVVNNTDGSTADVLTVSTNTLTFREPLTGGTDNDFDAGDSYDIYTTIQCTISGGNLTAVDTDGSTPIDAIQPTAFTQVLLAQASQSTLVVTGSGVLPGDITDIADAVWDELLGDHLTAATTGRRLALLGYTNGRIYIDANNGSAGSTVGVNGTIDNPVTTLADAVTLATATGLREYHLHGPITLTSTHDDWVFVGEGSEPQINLGGQDIADSQFIGCTLSGDAASNSIVAQDCLFDGVTNVTGTFIRCRFNDTTSFSAGTISMMHGASHVPGTSTPVFDLQGVANIQFRGYNGGIELRNSSSAGQNTSIDMVSGQVILAASNTAGTIVVRGVGTLTNNANGATTVTADFVQQSKLLKLAQWIGLR